MGADFRTGHTIDYFTFKESLLGHASKKAFKVRRGCPSLRKRYRYANRFLFHWMPAALKGKQTAARLCFV